MEIQKLFQLIKTGISLTMVVTVSFILASCGSSGNGGVSGNGDSNFNVAVKMAGSSGCDYSNIVVTVGQVALNTRLNAMKDDTDWTTVTLNPPLTFDLLTLQNGKTLNLANLKIPAGTYQSILLSIVPNDPKSGTFNDYVILNNSVNKIPLSFPPGFPNKIAINFNKAVTISSNGTVSNIVIDFDACHSVVTSTDAQGNIFYFLRPRLMEINEDFSAGIVGAITTSSSSATRPEQLVVKAEVKGKDGNYYVVRQTRPNPDGSFRLYPLEYDDDSGGIYDVVVVSNNYGTVAIRDVKIPAHDGSPLSATTSASIGTIKLDTLHALTWSTTGTFTGTISPKGTGVRIRETVGGRTYQVRRQHSDLQTGIFTFPLSWGATTSAAYSTGAMTFTADSLTTAGSYTADTPTGDCDNDDRTVLDNQSFSFRITDGTKALTVTHDFVLVPVDHSGFPWGPLTASVTGTITAQNLPANDLEKVYVVALIRGRLVAGIDEVILSHQASQATYTIDHLPTGALVTIEAFAPDFEPNSLETITVLKGSPLVLGQGSNSGPDFILTE